MDISKVLKPGDVIMRLLTPYMVYHYGMVYKVSKKTNRVSIIDFSDEFGVMISDFSQFMMGRRYFWVNTFIHERRKYGDKVFNDLPTRMAIANRLYKAKNIRYCMEKYNCEYFIRRCVFKYNNLWESSQTKKVNKSPYMALNLFAKALLFSIGEIVRPDDKEIEKDLLPEYPQYYHCEECKKISKHNKDFIKCCDV